MFMGATRPKCSWLYLKNQCRNSGEKENGMSQKLYVQARFLKRYKNDLDPFRRGGTRFRQRTRTVERNEMELAPFGIL